MMHFNFNSLSDQTKGWIAIIGGIILLFHTMGIFTLTLSIILVVAALILILYGLQKTQLILKIKALTRKK